MPRFCCLCVLLLALPISARAALPKPLVEGLAKPESVCVGSDGRIFLSLIGEFDKDGDGAIVVLKDGKPEPFCTDLNDPKGLIAFGGFLFVTDKDRVLRIDAKGKATVLAAAKDFPAPPKFLNDIEVNVETGELYVSDSGGEGFKDGAVYRLTPKGQVSLVLNAKQSSALQGPNGLRMDGKSHLLLLNFGSGELIRIRLADKTTEKIADGFDGGDGLAWDYYGRLYISSWKQGKVWVLPRPGQKAVLVAEGMKSSADLCVDHANKRLLVPDMMAGLLYALPTGVPGQEVIDTPLSLEPTLAFPDLVFTGWKSANDKGQPTPLRPLVLTHAGDGSNRIFCATQHGVIHAFADDPKAKQTKVFLDLEEKVFYSDKENEQGLLGLAFHPRYQQTGEFFVFYTDRKKKTETVISRFKVSKDDPNKADPASEEELLRFARPFWNHDGGTLCFGPDGYLYIAVGDGGAADDPFDNGQKLSTLLGKILRIDVDRKDGDRNYAIPKDNPFVDRKEVRPEIWCYGLRNVWRMAFDRKTGQLWAGEVGQNLYEEINLIVKGGNYGWNRRESYHPFGVKGVDVNENMVEPIWEYHHDVGKSITGGIVYRGKALPELEGHYLYADYVTNRIWALKYDETKKRVVANRPIKDRGTPVLSFGEDEKGEAYFLVVSGEGKGIFKFDRSSRR